MTVLSWADCLKTMEMPKNYVLSLQIYRGRDQD